MESYICTQCLVPRIGFFEAWSLVTRDTEAKPESIVSEWRSLKTDRLLYAYPVVSRKEHRSFEIRLQM